MAKKWIASAIKHPGALTRKAKAADMTMSAYLTHPPRGITSRTKRQIALAKKLRTFNRSK